MGCSFAFGNCADRKNHISNTHVSPGTLVAEYLNLKEASLYILVQLMGAIFGAYLLTIFFGTSDLNMGAIAPSESVNFINAFSKPFQAEIKSVLYPYSRRNLNFY